MQIQQKLPAPSSFSYKVGNLPNVSAIVQCTLEYSPI